MEIQHNISLKEYNTFHVDCKAKQFVSIETAADFLKLLQSREWVHYKERILFLWGGSNILLTSPTFDGLVVCNNILGKEIVTDHEHEVFIKAGAWEEWSSFVERAIDHGLYGIENLISIPGKVGAAPIQNIGAYGTEIGNAIVSVWGYNLETKEYETISHKECFFGYRDSIFKGIRKDEFFITDVTFRLQHFDPDTYAPISNYGSVAEELAKKGITKPTPRHMIDTITEIRAEKLPDRHKVGTWGSFFKNAVLTQEEFEDFTERVHRIKPDLTIEHYPINEEFIKIPTGRVLDHVLGYRGHREWNVGCREKQALCIVNYGWASGQEILHFARKIQKECHDKLGIAIEPEVNFIG